MGALMNAFVISSVDEILGEFFRSADNIQDIRDALQSQECRAYCEEENIEYQKLIEKTKERSEVEDNNYFHQHAILHKNDDMFRRVKYAAHNTLEARVAMRAEYERVRKEASTLGFNAASYMPRLLNGDIVGTNVMLFMAILKIEHRISIRREMGAKDPAKAMKWMIQHAIYYTDDAGARKRKIKNLIMPSTQTPKQIVEGNEDFLNAAKAIMQLGHKQDEVYKMIVEITDDNPDMNTESIILYFLENRKC